MPIYNKHWWLVIGLLTWEIHQIDIFLWTWLNAMSISIIHQKLVLHCINYKCYNQHIRNRDKQLFCKNLGLIMVIEHVVLGNFLNKLVVQSFRAFLVSDICVNCMS